MNYLYHYTSLETLALILKNKTLAFNNLLNVDDIEEAKTRDMGNFGKFVYVSCWTEDKEESIPLWNLYTPNMHGVRIKLPEFPFKKYHYNKDECFFSEETDSFINYNDDIYKNKCSIAPNSPLLIQVKYTNDENKLFPIVKTESYEGAAEDYMNAKTLNELGDKGLKIKYSFEELGNYKRKVWEFQKEWRYKITVAPMGKEGTSPSLKSQQEYIRCLEDKESLPPVSKLFLEIDGGILDNIEVVAGPKMSESEKIITKALLEKYAPKSLFRESNLEIK